ncbi:CAZyme family GH17 [Penicillium roqueforti]|uniref:Probable beta-glucosidase btgE n=1 Tax=Penicillium roqueforti (strain FM164) TaxID=1365484 RepID=W6QU37_PENRF|nr:CAZyme family GH17 [Penicillium roqueforti]KAI3092772.1 CAZyme family GH17 [Penicillium roqueforti]KAI3182565.1 CAZyme family GH17 [Penicillium roqueforti]CDM33047.1 Glycoside hydrolase, superfamily [Penicillium roqueforti FM164]
MKGAIFAAALVGSAMADGVHRRHDAFHQRREAAVSAWSSAPAEAEQTCGCTTKVITVYGSATLVDESVVPATSSVPAETVAIPSSSSTPIAIPETSTHTSTVQSTSTSTLTVTVSGVGAESASSSVPAVSTFATSSVASTPAVVLPTPGVSTFSTTGVYTIPATTITVWDTTTVCGATSTEVPSGTVTYGGVTTIVETATTVTCPYATVKPSGSTVTSVIETTTYICPSAGTYTIVPPTTTSVPTSTVLVYPTPQTIVPGTYTQDETTVTVTRTDYTYICPAATNTLASTTAAVVPTTAAAATTAVPVVSTSTVAPVVPVSMSTASVVSSSSSTSSSASSSSTAKATGVPTVLGEGQYGMTYSPYTAAGDCKTKAAVLSDLTTIKSKGFNLVRVYSTDCSGLEYIGEACKSLGINIIMGVYIDGSGVSAAKEQVTEIIAWAEWSMVELIVVGNEAIQSGYVDAATLASFIESSAASFKAAGYTGLVTTTEPINVWQQYGSATLCSAVDIVGANIHPFFNADVTAAQAGEFTKSEFEELEEICGGKDVINLETGWPNAGDSNGAAVPGVSEQATAIKSIAASVGSKSIFFSFSDDTWKSAGEFNVEQHWGCSSVF